MSIRRFIALHNKSVIEHKDGDLVLFEDYAKLRDRVKAMYIGDLSPESRFTGYAVLVKNLEKRRDGLRAKLTAAQEKNQSFGNVLATIHRDGGHYTTQHGHQKASRDAIKMVLDMRTENRRLRDAMTEIEAVACGEEQIEGDGTYDDSDGLKRIYDTIQALKKEAQP